MQTQQRQTLQQQQQAQQKQTQQQTVQQQRQQMQQQGKLGTTQGGQTTSMARISRPLTPGEIQRGFTGKITPDGRALIKFQNRILTVPASRVSGSPRPAPAGQGSRQATKWTAQQQAVIASRTAKLLTSTSSNSVASRIEKVRLSRAEVGHFRSFGPMNKGPLPKDISDTFRSGAYVERSLPRDTVLYRVISDDGNPAGSYWTSSKPQGPLQAVSDSALDQSWGNRATKLVTARIPANTIVYEGFAAGQGGLPGGGNQIYIPKVNQNWIEE